MAGRGAASGLAAPLNLSSLVGPARTMTEMRRGCARSKVLFPALSLAFLLDLGLICLDSSMPFPVDPYEPEETHQLTVR